MDETGRPGLAPLVLRLVEYQSETRNTTRIAVHAEVSTTRTKMAIKTPFVLSSRLTNDCLVCQTASFEAPELERTY